MNLQGRVQDALEAPDPYRDVELELTSAADGKKYDDKSKHDGGKGWYTLSCTNEPLGEQRELLGGFASEQATKTHCP